MDVGRRKTSPPCLIFPHLQEPGIIPGGREPPYGFDYSHTMIIPRRLPFVKALALDNYPRHRKDLCRVLLFVSCVLDFANDVMPDR